MLADGGAVGAEGRVEGGWMGVQGMQGVGGAGVQELQEGVEGCIDCMGEEKDPRCLLQAFALLHT
ncbi:hypothetical protein B484DRAFT_389407, partial [Ochromonadaceae sp. CCMP2298]